MDKEDLILKHIDELQQDFKQFQQYYREDLIRRDYEFNKFQKEDEKTHQELLDEVSDMKKKMAITEERVKNLSTHRAAMIGFVSAVIATFLAYKIETMGHDVVATLPKKEKRDALGSDNPPDPRDP